VKYYTNASGGLASVDSSGVVNRYTVVRGWVITDDLTPQSLASMDWLRISAAEAIELARVIDRLPRPV
jgi:hypothetical protein